MDVPLRAGRRAVDAVSLASSLSARMLVTLLSLTLLTTLAVALAASSVISDRMTEQVGAQLRSSADAQAAMVGDLLSTQLRQIQAFSLSTRLQQAVVAANGAYTGDELAIRKEIERLELQWVQGAGAAERITQEILTSPVAEDLNIYEDTFRSHTEMMLTDRYGALIAATNLTSDYNQSDEAWWVRAWNGGSGGIYIGQPAFDESSQSLSVIIAVPVRAGAEQRPEGVLRTTFKVEALSDLLDTAGGKSDILLSDGQILTADGQVVQLGDRQVAALEEARSAAAAPLTYNGAQVLLSQSPVRTADNYTAAAMERLGWHVIIDQDQALALQPVQETRRILFFIGLGALLVAGVVALWLARNIISPVLALKQMAQRLTRGELDQEIVLNRRDEFGVLAQSFNTMAAVLQERLADQLSAQEAAQWLAKREAQERQRLEQAVATFLEFVGQIGAGELDQRLVGIYPGALGELTLGLNGMAERLEQLAERAQQLQRQEQAGRERLEQAVAEYLAFVQQVGHGNLAGRLEVGHSGALGQLGHGLNSMTAGLAQLTGQLREAATNIAATAAEILAATQQQSAASAQQATALSQTTTTIEEVRAIAQQTAGQAAQVAGDSQSALSAAQDGIDAVEQTIGGMGTIRDQTEEIAQTILALTERAQAIGTIVATVAELADQSNLLALNAAIEAARAGAQGKSFAVVAQHVRDLAERSKLATVQVRDILGEIQHATHRAVLVTEEGTKGVEVGASLAGAAGQVIQRIVAEVEGGAQSNVQMASAAQQQLVGMDQIGQAMQTIQQAATQTLASTRQAERAAQALHSLAQQLQQLTATYQLVEGER